MTVNYNSETLANIGTIGIGTSTPLQTLHVNTSASGNPSNTGSGADANACVRVQMVSIGLDIGTTLSGTTWIQNRQPGTSLATTFPMCLNPLGGNIGINTTTAGSTLTVNGSVSKTSGTFDIQHPILPYPRRLIHSFIEGPRCDLVYRGVTQLVNGTSNINLDRECTSNISCSMTEGTFESLCANPTYFLQNDETFDRLIGKIKGNILTVICENIESTVRVNWMVVAERRDQGIKQWDHTDPDGFLVTEYDMSP